MLHSLADNRKFRMATPAAVPLFPPYDELLEFSDSAFPEVATFLAEGQAWRKQHWGWGCDFLKYIGRNKSEHTYLRFRTEVERFLLWVFLFKDAPVDDLRKKDILEFADYGGGLCGKSSLLSR